MRLGLFTDKPLLVSYAVVVALILAMTATAVSGAPVVLVDTSRTNDTFFNTLITATG